MAEALAINDYREPQYHGRKSKPWGNGIPANLARAKVAREPKPPPAPAARIEVAPIVPASVANSRAPVIGRRIVSYEDVVQAFRDRADDLEISRNELDGLTGLADAHCSMLLTKSHMKVFGPRSLPAMLKVLGLRFRIEEDLEKTELTLRRRQRRVTTHAHYGLQFSPISGPIKGWLFGYPAPIAGKRKR
jgi:hypothetical protein